MTSQSTGFLFKTRKRPRFSSDNVSILLGTGDGTFSVATNFAVGDSPRRVVISDLNGDGKPDLAVTHYFGIAILLGDGTGAFGSATNFAVENTPRSVAIGNLNDDGRPDLAATDLARGNVSILLNTTAPETAITSAMDGCGAAVASGEASLSSSITFTFVGTDAVDVAGFQCSLDGSSFTRCTSPATYTGMASGTHSFQVRAVDPAGNVDPTPATFNWTILTPAQAIQSLIAQVQGLVPLLNQGQANSLIATLNAAIQQLNKGNRNPAVNQLNAFINHVNAFMDGNNPNLTQAQGQPLIAVAQAIINVLLSRPSHAMNKTDGIFFDVKN